MNQQQTIDWLQARLTSAEDTTLSLTRDMSRMAIKMILQEDVNMRLQGEVERLREALTTIAGPPECDPDLLPIYQPRWSVEQCRYIARAALQPKEDVQ